MANKPIASVTTATPAEADQVLGVKAGATRLFSLLAVTNLVGVNIRKFYETADGSNWSPALNRALAVSPHVDFPAGNYTFVTPVDYIQGMVLTGAKEMKSSAVGGTRITANAGWLKNDNTTRKQIIIRNFYIKGNKTLDVAGIDGPFGGVIEGCKIESFESLVRNASGYLCQYIRDSFADADFGINTADANGTVIENCHFNADVGVQVSTRDVTPQTGTASGLPLSIRENNFNAADGVTACLRVRGQLDIRANYFEKFAGGAVETRFMDIEANRFDHQGAIIESNELNGQSSNATALYLNGSHAGLDNPMEGRFTCNRIIGCAHDVQYGPNNRIPGFKIYGNYNIIVENSYQGQHIPNYDGWTYVRLDSDFTTSSATSVDVTNLVFTPEPSAQYIVEGLFMMRSATATVGPRPGVAWPTNVGDGVIFTQASSSAAATVPRYGNTSATFETVVGDVADTTGSWPFLLNATFIAPSNVSGTFKIIFRSETAATNVTLRAGSYIRYKRIA